MKIKIIKILFLIILGNNFDIKASDSPFVKFVLAGFGIVSFGTLAYIHQNNKDIKKITKIKEDTINTIMKEIENEPGCTDDQRGILLTILNKKKENIKLD